MGLTHAGAWWFTSALSTVAFDPHPMQSLGFTGPASKVLNWVLFVTDKPVSFDLGLVPDVFLGSLLAAALFGELKLEGFQGGPLSQIGLSTPWPRLPKTDRAGAAI